MKTPPAPPASSPLLVWMLLLAGAAMAGYGLGGWARYVRPARPAVPWRHPVAVPATYAVLPPDPLGGFDDEVTASTRIEYRRRWRLGKAAAALDPSALVAALERERQRMSAAVKNKPADDYSPEDELPAEALLARYAEMNPQGAAAWIADVYKLTTDTHTSWLDVLLGVWTSQDPAAAIAWVKNLKRDGLRTTAQTELLTALANRDPALAMEQLRAMPDVDSHEVDTLFWNIAAKNLRFARGQIDGLPQESRKAAVAGLVRRWVDSGDPREAYAWAMGVTSPAARQEGIRAVYQAWPNQDSAAAGAWLLAHGTVDLEFNASTVAGAYAAVDPTGALAWCQQLPVSARRQALENVIWSWSCTDPRATADYLVALPEDDDRNRLDDAVQNWAKRDPDAARAWVEALPTGTARQKALEGLGLQMFSVDPRAGVVYLDRQADRTAVKDRRAMLVASWAASDPDAVWNYSQTLTDPAESADTAAAALRKMVAMDPARAVSLFAQIPADAQAKAATAMVEEWVDREPEATAQWAATLSEGPIRDAGWKVLIDEWENRDPAAAATWLRDQPACDARDQGITKLLVNAAGEIEPRDAIRLARTVGAADGRLDALTSVAQGWLQRDRAAATVWISRAKEFTPGKRAALLRIGDGDSGE